MCEGLVRTPDGTNEAPRKIGSKMQIDEVSYGAVVIRIRSIHLLRAPIGAVSSDLNQRSVSVAAGD